MKAALGRVGKRQGVLISTLVHLMILSFLIKFPHQPARLQSEVPAVPPPPARPVFLPPREVLRELLRPAPTPPPPAAPKPRERISVGPPSLERSKGPLILRREDDLTAPPAGPRGDSPGSRGPTASVPPPMAPPAPSSEGRRPATGQGSPVPPGPPESPSIASSVERRLGTMGSGAGGSGAAGRQMGPLFFDPQGADFTAWINHFKNEVYRNWIVPQAALFGYRGHADFEFNVERDGSITDLKLLKSSGTPALDRAAQNALLASRLLPLPADFGPARAVMQVSFFYNEGPQGS